MSEQLEYTEKEDQGIYENFFSYLENSEKLIPKQVRFNGFEILEGNKIKVEVFYNGQKCGYFFKQSNEEDWNYISFSSNGDWIVNRKIF